MSDETTPPTLQAVGYNSTIDKFSPFAARSNPNEPPPRDPNEPLPGNGAGPGPSTVDQFSPFAPDQTRTNPPRDPNEPLSPGTGPDPDPPQSINSVPFAPERTRTNPPATRTNTSRLGGRAPYPGPYPGRADPWPPGALPRCAVP